MSTYYLQIIPKDPWYVPSPDQIEDAISFLKQSIPDYGHTDIQAKIEEIPIWIHPVEMYEAILCPLCAQDIEEWWWELLNRMYDEKWFAPLNGVMLPCCGAVVPMNELDYRPDTGFATFRFEVRDPHISWRDLPSMPLEIDIWGSYPPPEMQKPNWVFDICLSKLGLERVEELLSCKVKQFYQNI